MQLTPRALCAAGRAAFRESFPVGGRDVARWFPGHMAKGKVWRAAAGRTVYLALRGSPWSGAGGGCGDLVPGARQGPSAARFPKLRFPSMRLKM